MVQTFQFFSPYSRGIPHSLCSCRVLEETKNIMVSGKAENRFTDRYCEYAFVLVWFGQFTLQPMLHCACNYSSLPSQWMALPLPEKDPCPGANATMISAIVSGNSTARPSKLVAHPCAQSQLGPFSFLTYSRVSTQFVPCRNNAHIHSLLMFLTQQTLTVTVCFDHIHIFDFDILFSRFIFISLISSFVQTPPSTLVSVVHDGS